MATPKVMDASPPMDSPAAPITVPDAYALGQQMRAEGRPLEIPADLQGDFFSAQQEAVKAGYGEVE